MRIGLFVPVPEVGIATLELLERFGHEVVYPCDQTCCGQPMANSSFNAECAATEALFVRNFSGFDYIVAPRAAAFTTCETISMPSSRPRRTVLGVLNPQIHA
jgi:Fe-S oxidoreductase